MSNHTVEAFVQIRIKAESREDAYKRFQKFMADLFNNAYNQSEDPDFVPTYFAKIRVTEDIEIKTK